MLAGTTWAGGDPWVLSMDGFEPAVEGTREALLTVGNGHLATRGALAHARADEVHYPGTYVAGLYNRLVSVVEGRSREDESLVNLPNWLYVTHRCADGRWFSSQTGTIEDHRVRLDLRSGVLWREAVLVEHTGRRTRLHERRIASMADRRLAALELRLRPENWSGRLELRSLVDGAVANHNVPAYHRLAGAHLDVTELQHDGSVACVVAETCQSRVRVAVAARSTLVAPAGPGATRPLDEADAAGHELSADVEIGDEVVLEKVAAVATSHDRAVSEASDAARDAARGAPAFADLLSGHVEAWENLWTRFDVTIGGDPGVALAVRAYLFHLLQTLSPHTIDLDVGVPARGLHGEAYRGHVFWDELFVFPLMNLRLPELTRSLLMYRWRRLPAARRRAASLGCRGALFPWQSGSDGREETPKELFNPRSSRWMPDRSARQYHVNVAVAYNVWQHWQVTGDLTFLVDHGAELLIEAARFFASLAVHDPAADRYDLRAVMGPDEFHDGYPDRPGSGVDNNAYVNVMAAWALGRASEVHLLIGAALGHELWDRLGVERDELDLWAHVGERLRLPFLRNGLLAQFEGYEDLSELDWDGYRSRYGDIGRLDLILEAEGDTPNRYKASKQADVLMLFYLLAAEDLSTLIRRMGYDFDPATIPATVDYYLARTTHGSTLSRVVHAWVLARTDRSRSWDLLRQALGTDLAGRDNTTRRGIHLGAMGGSIDLLERCYTGLETHGDVLRFNPLLPDELPRLELVLRYRSHILDVRADHEQLTVASAAGPARPITVAVRDDLRRLRPGEAIRFRLARRRRS